MTSRPRVGVVGSINVDLVVRVTALPRPGETIIGSDVVRGAGGKGANQAVASARLGADVAMWGCVGTDDNGAWMASHLRAQGVDTEFLQSSPRPTGVALITVDARGENEIVVSPGANHDLHIAPSALASCDVVLTQLELPMPLVTAVVEAHSRVVLNVAPAQEVDPAVLAQCSVVIANEIESELLDISSLAHCVVTRGAQGASVYFYGVEHCTVAPPAVTPIDTVGAGDAFCAAYATELARGSSPLRATQVAVVAGACATQGEGAQGALPTMKEIEEWLARAS